MSFYVPVGPRGFLFRAGTLLTGVMGSVSYWWSSRCRALDTSKLNQSIIGKSNGHNP
jgi:hypothetical protein